MQCAPSDHIRVNSVQDRLARQCEHTAHCLTFELQTFSLARLGQHPTPLNAQCRGSFHKCEQVCAMVL